jgi:hypothetical protein
MTNPEIRMKNEVQMSNDECAEKFLFVIWESSFVRHSGFVIRHYPA